jgi:hypothetical protein
VSVLERGAETARAILDRRDPYGAELRDNAFCRLMLTEAYARAASSPASSKRKPRSVRCMRT